MPSIQKKSKKNTLKKKSKKNTKKKSKKSTFKKNIIKGGSKCNPKAALIIIDVQKCFTEGGTLGDFPESFKETNKDVPKEPRKNIINNLKKLIPYFNTIVATEDWHPPKHVSFASTYNKKPFIETKMTQYGKQELWPDHCMQNKDQNHLTDANLHPDLEIALQSTLNDKTLNDKTLVAYDSTNITNIPQSSIASQSTIVFRKGTRKDVDSYSAFNEADKQDTGLASYLKKRRITDVYIAGIATDYCVKFSALDALQKHKFNVYMISDASAAIYTSSGDKAITDMKTAGVVVLTTDQVLQPIFRETKFCDTVLSSLIKKN